jgi:rRNA biogenesis protein RRP5
VFNRALSRKLTAKQAKYVCSVLPGTTSNHFPRFFFKKWLDLERRIGDEAGADAVKEKAVAWMQCHTGES